MKMFRFHRFISQVTFLVLLICDVTQATTDFPELDHIVPSEWPSTQANAVTALIKRLVPYRAEEFSVLVDPNIGPENKDTFVLLTVDNKLTITGTSGVAASMGFYYYLSQYCYCHISWAGNQVNLPAILPVIPEPGVTITSNDRFRYYQNVCTVSYSFVWWDWPRWEQEIDWMAMNGINLPLAFNGAEAIWQRVYTELGLTQKELDIFFPGPAFLAWFRMGNMHRWGGPLSDAWHSQQVDLQHKILDRMRSFGMIPVLPAFGGYVPQSLNRIFPNVSLSRRQDWGRFNSTYCCDALLDVTSPVFRLIGRMFVSEYTKEFGTNHIYNTDTFNEMTPPSSNSSYISAASKAVYRGMKDADEKAVWLMQGWLFQETYFWTPPKIKSYVGSVPKGRLIILDLMSDITPIYTKTHSYYGHPFIWCMLHNFGGSNAMYGALESINQGPFEGRAFPNSSMIGTGLTPEGINQNNVMYEFMNENAWRPTPRDINKWMANYATRRYGAFNSYAEKAWQLLGRGLYNHSSVVYKDHNYEDPINMRPRLNPVFKPTVWYEPEQLFQAWDNILMAAEDLPHSKLFIYDLVDITRQSLEIISSLYYTKLIKHYNKTDLDGLQSWGKSFTDLLVDMDSVLGTCEQFLLGRWISDARARGSTAAEKDLFEYNARNQVTLWGPHANILDYANKQWSGLIKSYYLPRWQLFIQELQISVIEGRSFDKNQFNLDVFRLAEEPFTFDKTVFPSQPQGDAVSTAFSLNYKYRPVTRKFADFFHSLVTQEAEEVHSGIHSGISGDWFNQNPVNKKSDKQPSFHWSADDHAKTHTRM